MSQEAVENAILDEFTAGFNADALPDYDADGLRARAVDAATNLVEVLGPEAADASALLRAMIADRRHPFLAAVGNDTNFGWNGSDANFAGFQSLATIIADGIDRELA